MTPQNKTRAQWTLLLFFALALRLTYQLSIVALDGTVHNGSDTSKYVWRALSILEHGHVEWNEATRTGLDTERMPLYPYFLAFLFWFADGAKLHFVTVVQAFIDVGTVTAIALTAREFNHRYTMPAAILAAISPSLIIFTAWVLTDSLFLFSLAWATFGCVRLLRIPKSLSSLFIATLFFSIAMLIRPTLLIYWIGFVPVFYLLLRYNTSQSSVRSAVLAIIPALAMVTVVSTIAFRNANNFGSFVVSTQTGNHAVQIVNSILPFCKTCNVEKSMKVMLEKIHTRTEELPPKERVNPVTKDRIWRGVALEHLEELPLGAIVLAATDGMLRSLLQTSVYEAAIQFRLNPNFFSSVEAPSFAGRLRKFSSEVLNSAYLSTWSIIQFLALISVPIQFIGIVVLLSNRKSRAPAAFLLFTSAYVLAINGPIGSPKYGLPIIPTLIILTVTGGVWLLHTMRIRPIPDNNSKEI